MDIELDSKQLSFGQVLLYRRNFLTCFIRNRSPVEIFWHLNANEPLDPQISFTPIKGVVKPQSDQKIEFYYHASKVKNLIKLLLNYISYIISVFSIKNFNLYFIELNLNFTNYFNTQE